METVKIVHDVIYEQVRHSLGRRVQNFVTKVALRSDGEKELLVQVLASLRETIRMLYEKYVKAVAKPQDLAQMNLITSEMRNHISTPIMNIEQLTPEHLLTVIQKSQNSGATINLDEALFIEFTHVRKDPGWSTSGEYHELFPGGHRRPEFLYYGNYNQKRSIIEVTSCKSKDNACLAKCIIVGYIHLQLLQAKRKFKEGHPKISMLYAKFRELTKNKDKSAALTTMTKELYAKALIPYRKICNLNDLKTFESILNVSIKIVSSIHQHTIRYKGPLRKDGDYIYLLYTRNHNDDTGHFRLITNIKGFFGNRQYCTGCDVAYNHKYDHKCKYTRLWYCFSCHQDDCRKHPSAFRCEKCGAQVQSEECRRIHNTKECNMHWTCSVCNARRDRLKVFQDDINTFRYKTNDEMEHHHDCESFICHVCEIEVSNDHKCFIKKKVLKKPDNKYLFFDCETDQSSKKHFVNYLHMTYFEPKEDIMPGNNFNYNQSKRCKVNDQLENIYDHDTWQGEWKTKTYSGIDSIHEFLADIVINFKDYTCLAHNFKGFDGIFVLESFFDKGGFKPEVILRGLKIMQLVVPKCNIRFIDSFNFLPMALSKLPAAFGLNCGEKGAFPHFFNTKQNQNYVGPYPEPDDYGYKYMTANDQQMFMEWYKLQKGKTFNFQLEIAKYCAQDVMILKESCLAFRKIMCQETGCDPFQYTTLASVCSAVYMSQFMKENTIARVPPSGYSYAKYSSEAIEWLEYLRRYENLPEIQHALNGGEIRIGKFRVDGYVKSTKTVYEYYGCFFHGCKKCFHDDIINPDTHRRIAATRAHTLKREIKLRQDGYQIVVKWACDWKYEKQQNVALAQKVKDMNLQPPLNPRDAFFGGRTETFKIWAKAENDEEIAYEDVTSLYPWVNCCMPYPVGHPIIITHNFNNVLDNYFGIIQCKILPPKNLYLPVLPMHVGCTKTLLFPLCKTCAEQFQTAPCAHTDEQRIITGTWFTEEVKLAIEMGYELQKIHTIWHFQETSTDLFADYIKTFYKKKLLSSKLSFNSIAEINTYIKDVQKNEGIQINSAEDFKENAGLRALTKLMLNNLWGRFGMRENLSKTEFVNTYKELNSILDDTQIEIENIRAINSSVTQVTYKSRDLNFLPASKDTNIFIAITTTAWARIRLYKEMRKLNERLLYCDTDSVIYKKSKNPSENLHIGKFLGEMTDELEGDYIIEFISGGPKNYGYLTKKGKISVKVKGFSRNATNDVAFSFEHLKSIILCGMTDAEGEPLPQIISENDRKKIIELYRTDFKAKHYENRDDISAFSTDKGISIFNPNKICRTRDWFVLSKEEQKLYTFYFRKRVIKGYDTYPMGYSDEASNNVFQW